MTSSKLKHEQTFNLSRKTQAKWKQFQRVGDDAFRYETSEANFVCFLNETYPFSTSTVFKPELSHFFVSRH